MTQWQKSVVVVAMLLGLAAGLLMPRLGGPVRPTFQPLPDPRSNGMVTQGPLQKVPQMVPPAAGLEFGVPRSSKQRGTSDVVLVSLDTTRADYLQPYGSGLPSSPFLEAFAKQSVTFTQAYATSSWTSPSMASLMTGVYPSQHGATQVVSRDDLSVAVPVLAPQKTTLAELLNDAGYSTFSVNSNMLLCEEVGFAQGFEHIVEQDNAPRPFQRAIVQAMGPHMAASPKYMLWAHYVDPHWPYRPRAPWFARWNNSPFETGDAFLMDAALWDYRNGLKKTADANVELSHLPQFFARAEKAFINNQIGIDAIRSLTAGATQKALVQDRVRYLSAAYRSEIRGMDEDIGRLLKGLDLDDDALVIIVADHGEEFLEHGNLGHISESLYQELIRVPLMIRFPKGKHAGQVFEQPVSLVDLMPTVLGTLDLPLPTGLPGVDLDARLRRAPGEGTARHLVSELTHHTGVQMRSVVHYPWKFIYHFDNKRGELYNLRNDPDEQVDLASKEVQTAQQLLAWLKRWVESPGGNTVSPTPKFQLPKADAARLRALGYAPN